MERGVASAAAGGKDASADLSTSPKSRAARARTPHRARPENTLCVAPDVRYGGRAWSGEHRCRAILVREQQLPGFHPLTVANCQGRSKAVKIGTEQGHCRWQEDGAMAFRAGQPATGMASPRRMLVIACRRVLSMAPRRAAQEESLHLADRSIMPVSPQAPASIPRCSGHGVESGSRSALQPPARKRLIDAVTGAFFAHFAVQAISGFSHLSRTGNDRRRVLRLTHLDVGHPLQLKPPATHRLRYQNGFSRVEATVRIDDVDDRGQGLLL